MGDASPGSLIILQPWGPGWRGGKRVPAAVLVQTGGRPEGFTAPSRGWRGVRALASSGVE